MTSLASGRTERGSTTPKGTHWSRTLFSFYQKELVTIAFYCEYWNEHDWPQHVFFIMVIKVDNLILCRQSLYYVRSPFPWIHPWIQTMNTFLLLCSKHQFVFPHWRTSITLGCNNARLSRITSKSCFLVKQLSFYDGEGDRFRLSSVLLLAQGSKMKLPSKLSYFDVSVVCWSKEL